MAKNLVTSQAAEQQLELHFGDAPTIDSYAKTSIASFGEQMLKSMGWYEGRGIGKTPQIFNPVEIKPRHHRQGLGADNGDYLGRKGHVVECVDNYSFAFQLDPPFSSVLYDLKERQVEPIESKVGDLVCIINKENRGKFGRVLEKANNNNLAIIELEEGGEIINIVSQKIATIINNE